MSNHEPTGCLLALIVGRQREARISTVEIAAAMNMSVDGVRRRLRGQTGMTVRWYLRIAQVIGFDAAHVLELAQTDTRAAAVATR